MKLFHQISSNLSTTLREYRRLKGLWKGPTLKKALKYTITKFEETGKLDVLLGRGRKRLSDETVEEVTFAVIERAPDSQFYSSTARTVSLDFSLPCLQSERFLDPL
ncbi:hypothetical protein AVEN_269293-1 [Araneus ventricosus]|uniref:DUF4817 domain-containing protein n=1 Tax=Araneus ventricosus TaxID=182803 RepID=A0A4Y2L4F9_ARAVE|nr:hypothetical protein AVEN_269293-1 [Araneus ventricosus]